MRLSTRVAGIILKDTNILLIHRTKPDREYWVLPGGGLEDTDSSPEAGLLREISEETTLSVEVLRLIYTHDYTTNNGLYYLCRYISGQPKLGDFIEKQKMESGKDDLYEPAWVPVSTLPNLLLYPLEIRDWLISDLKDNFVDTPRAQKIETKDLRGS